MVMARGTQVFNNAATLQPARGLHAQNPFGVVGPAVALGAIVKCCGWGFLSVGSMGNVQ